MLETKGLYKIYKPKKGVPVTALNNVTIQFPDRGMVFLLGKSGSGKSTLLNVLGGLDQYDKGEIIIKGVSSRDFKQQHFDSYRNTYVGFIFQEYNVLEDFTVGANIGLALELQGKKAADEEINEILEQVDLQGYGSRKPNELSGGQKQRVAIARALVKKPEIIMADEPTGALDSNTGRQVLDTLKKLSADKLVIVVSHDREFAEQYADRIIELADGIVISDMERSPQESAVPEEAEGLTFGEHGIEVAAGYALTEEDRLAINEYLAGMKKGGRLSIRTSGRKRAGGFAPTDPGRIARQDGSHFQLIKSKLPLHNAFKIGGSGLKHKKVRLVITIFLSCIAFGLFGLADTFGAYNHVSTCTKSILDTGITYTSIVKAKKAGSGLNSYWRDYGYTLTDEELKQFEAETGVHLRGVYKPGGADLSFSNQIDSAISLSKTDYQIYATAFSGYAEISEADLKAMGYSLLAGKLPDGNKDEIAISAYLAETFIRAGYAPATAEGTPVYQKIGSAADMVGKVLTLDGKDFTVSGVVDTRMDLARYTPLLEEKEYMTTAEKLVYFALANEFSYSSRYSLACVAMVGSGMMEKLIAAQPPVKDLTAGNLYFYNDTMGFNPQYIGRLSDFKKDQILWLDGEKETLGEKEIILTSDLLAESGLAQDTAVYGGADSELPEQMDPQALIALAQKMGSLRGGSYSYTAEDSEELSDYRIVGVIDIGSGGWMYSAVITGDALYQQMTEDTAGDYSFAVGGMPEDQAKIRQLVSYCYREDTNIRFPLQNSVTYELDIVHDALKMLSEVFLYIGLFFAVFAALMLANFISTSISYKKQEIGILRAIGSRSSDVFRIFFAESFIIAMINFVLSCIGVFAGTAVINHLLRNEVGILITVLNFGPRQILLLRAVSLLVAAAASYIPVKRIASKRPIDAIRNR